MCQFNHKILVSFLSLNKKLGTIFGDWDLFGVQHKRFFTGVSLAETCRENTQHYSIQMFYFSLLFYL